jgi:hypothetical protein
LYRALRQEPRIGGESTLSCIGLTMRSLQGGQPVQGGIDFVHDMHKQNDTMQISNVSGAT